MADALCGPSNALQNFQKHAHGDRTLQQDRLITRQGLSQGFRSAPLNAGILDPEFEAFQAGLATGPSPFQPEPLRPFIPPHTLQHVAQPAPSLGGWASDFQRLHISSPEPSSVYQVQPQSVVRPAPAGHQHPAVAAPWHTDFLQSNSLPSLQSHRMTQPDFSWPQMQGPQSYMPLVSSRRQQEPGADDPMDAAAFERAFDAAREELLQAEAETQAEAERQAEEADTSLDSVHWELQQETYHLAAQERAMIAERAGPLVGEAVGDLPLSIQQEQQKSDEKSSPQDDDELSQVAGQLLDSVSHETSEKFQSSSFLQLMRRLRDKEVRVEGENFVETGTSSAALLNSSAVPPREQDLDVGRYGTDRRPHKPYRPPLPVQPQSANSIRTTSLAPGCHFWNDVQLA